MKWYRLLKSSDDGTTVTVPSGVTLVATDAITAGSAAVSGTFGVSGVASFIATPQIVGTSTNGYGKKVFHATGSLTGPTVDFIIGVGFTAAGPTPANIGDIYVNTTTGKMYISGGSSATSDWKLVTSA